MRVVVLIVLLPFGPRPRRQSTQRDGTRHDQRHPVAEQAVLSATGRGRRGIEAARSIAAVGGGRGSSVVVGHVGEGEATRLTTCQGFGRSGGGVDGDAIGMFVSC